MGKVTLMDKIAGGAITKAHRNALAEKRSNESEARYAMLRAKVKKGKKREAEKKAKELQMVAKS